MADIREHVADGIEEYDNPLPRWWVYLFLVTVAIAAGYCVLYPSAWFWGGTRHWTSTGQLEQEIARAKSAAPPAFAGVTDSAASALEQASHDPAVVAQGRTIFAANCAVCHGEHAEGKIGPLLRKPKQAFKYGGEARDILTTITGGRPGGMPTWGKLMGPDKIATVAAFVYSLRYDLPQGGLPSPRPASAVGGARPTSHP